VIQQFRTDEEEFRQKDKLIYQTKLVEVLKTYPLVSESSREDLKKLSQHLGFSKDFAASLEDEYLYCKVFQNVIRNYDLSQDDLSQTNPPQFTESDQETIQHYRKALDPQTIQAIEERVIAIYQNTLTRYILTFQEALQHSSSTLLSAEDRLALRKLRSRYGLRVDVIKAIELRLTKINPAFSQSAISIATQAEFSVDRLPLLLQEKSPLPEVSSDVALRRQSATRKSRFFFFVAASGLGALAISVGAIALVDLIRLPDVPPTLQLTPAFSTLLPVLGSRFLGAIADEAQTLANTPTGVNKIELAHALKVAILKAHLLPPNSEARTHLQPFIAKWSQKMLWLAEEAYNQSDLNSAIRILQEIPEAASTFVKANELRTIWENHQTNPPNLNRSSI